VGDAGEEGGVEGYDLVCYWADGGDFDAAVQDKTKAKRKEGQLEDEKKKGRGRTHASRNLIDATDSGFWYSKSSRAARKARK
jgi:hypothetical protein